MIEEDKMMGNDKRQLGGSSRINIMIIISLQKMMDRTGG